MHGNEDGSIPATFQVIYMVRMHLAFVIFFPTLAYPFLAQIGWKPSPTQRKPLERGSAQTSLKDVL